MEKETIEVQDVGVQTFNTKKEAARLIAFMEGLQLEDADYWLQQPVAAFQGLGEAIRLKIKTMESEVAALRVRLENALQPPQKSDIIQSDE